MKKTESMMKMILAGLTGFEIAAYADLPSGIVGGTTTDNSAYAALFTYPSRTVTPISGLPGGGDSYLLSVAINDSGVSLIGGISGSDQYAAFVSPNGILTPLNLSVGGIDGVAINQSGLGLIGGSTNTEGYAAFVSSDGTIHSIAIPDAYVYFVGLNDSGVGLVGGEGSGMDLPMYAAYVYASGSVAPLTLPSDNTGEIEGVAVNDLGNGIICGYSNDPSVNGAYAAFVTPAGGVLPLSPLPTGGYLSGAAINRSGNGLVGGNDGSGNAFAAYAAPNGAATSLFSSPFSGEIEAVALNDAGVGLLGGQNGADLYAALVHPGGSLTLLFPISAPAGTIQSVALNDAGVGVIGGYTGVNAYAALVAPNGAITPLNLTGGSEISSVALVNQATPQSAGPYAGAFSAHLAAAAALEARFIQQNSLWSRGTAKSQPVANNENLAQNDLAKNPQTASMPLGKTPPSKPNSFWFEPFGNYVHLKSQGSLPSANNEVGGFLLGYDRKEDHYLAGVSAGYAFNYVHYSESSESLGHTKLQEEMLSFYGAYYNDNFWLDGSLWGGLYQFTNERRTLGFIASTGKKHGWILSPHFEIAAPHKIDRCGCYFIEPFALADWINNWQLQYTETGSSGLNLQVPSVYNSLLQSEVGLRFYERLVFAWGDVRLEEKLSYVNQVPFNVRDADVSFVSSAATIPIAVASTQIQNLGSINILGSFVPTNRSYPYGGFEIQATAGSSYQSYFVSLFGGIDF